MKKSILRRMAEEVENRTEVPQPETNEPSVSLRRHSSPVISNVGKALTHLGEDTIVSIDPSKVERSPYQDRFDLDGEGEEELEALKQSIASEGQKIPVLVRPHPTRRDSYQLAYGHRRLNAVKALMAEAERPETVKIRAYVRDLTDRQLIEEQAVENGVRQNLTWIEQAMWAVQLKAAGLSNRAICPVLGLSEAAVSHLFRVTSAIRATSSLQSDAPGPLAGRNGRHSPISEGCREGRSGSRRNQGGRVSKGRWCRPDRAGDERGVGFCSAKRRSR